jgi:hypothetical protein
MRAAFALLLPPALVAGADANTLIAYAAWPKAAVTRQHQNWSQQLDRRTTADENSAAWIRGHGLAGTTAVIWSSSAWPYLLADLELALPTAPIYNDVVLLGSGSEVVARVEQIQPEVIVTSADALQQWPEIESLLDADYQLTYQDDPDSVYLRAIAP